MKGRPDAWTRVPGACPEMTSRARWSTCTTGRGSWGIGLPTGVSLQIRHARISLTSRFRLAAVGSDWVFELAPQRCFAPASRCRSDGRDRKPADFGTLFTVVDFALPKPSLPNSAVPYAYRTMHGNAGRRNQTKARIIPKARAHRRREPHEAR